MRRHTARTTCLRAHPTFASFAAILCARRYECAKRDIEKCGRDLYQQYGGFDAVFRQYVKACPYLLLFFPCSAFPLPFSLA